MTEEDITKVPELILAYMAPMQCGEKYRKELLRRQQAGIATGDRLGKPYVKLENTK